MPRWAMVVAVLSPCAGASDFSGQSRDNTPPTPGSVPTMSEKPHVYVPAGEAPPAELVIEDMEEGTGEEAKAGHTVEAHYAGNAWSTRQQFDASWDRGDTFSFRLGAGQVIGGWDQGVVG